MPRMFHVEHVWSALVVSSDRYNYPLCCETRTRVLEWDKGRSYLSESVASIRYDNVIVIWKVKTSNSYSEALTGVGFDRARFDVPMFLPTIYQAALYLSSLYQDRVCQARSMPRKVMPSRLAPSTKRHTCERYFSWRLIRRLRMWVSLP